MAAVKTYDPKDVSLIVGGKIISGFSDGTGISLEYNEQHFTLKVGTDGEGTRAKNNNFSGKITIELMQSSSSNDDLNAFALADRLNNSGAVPMYLKDNLGSTIATCLTCWVQKLPTTSFAKDVSVRSWVLETDNLNLAVGGN